MGKMDEIWILHRRMGHINFDKLVKIIKKKEFTDIPKIKNPLHFFLQALLKWKENESEI